jgi:hypothetical protein
MPRLRLLVGENIGVTSIQDSHGAAAEEFPASSAELNLKERQVSLLVFALQSLQETSSLGRPNRQEVCVGHCR